MTIRLATFACIFGAFTLGEARAQDRPAQPLAPDTTVTAADPADVGSVDAILAALYDVISGPAGERDWDRFRSLFVPGARLIPSVPDSAGASVRVMSVEDYVERAGAFFKTNGFFEREVARRTEAFGNIAHAFSTYESRTAESDPDPFQRGINSIQLLKDGDRWWVVTIYWDAERADNPIPAEYLSGAAGARREREE